MSSRFSDEDVQRIGETIGDGLAEIRANAARVPEIEKKVDILTDRLNVLTNHLTKPKRRLPFPRNREVPLTPTMVPDDD
jgi:hypothetical protein